jgi:hypothetical protein
LAPLQARRRHRASDYHREETNEIGLGGRTGHVCLDPREASTVEIRIGAIETRFSGQEDRMTRALALLAHIVARIDGELTAGRQA